MMWPCSVLHWLHLCIFDAYIAARNTVAAPVQVWDGTFLFFYAIASIVAVLDELVRPLDALVRPFHPGPRPNQMLDEVQQPHLRRENIRIARLERQAQHRARIVARMQRVMRAHDACHADAAHVAGSLQALGTCTRIVAQ